MNPCFVFQILQEMQTKISEQAHKEFRQCFKDQKYFSEFHFNREVLIILGTVWLHVAP